MISTVYKSSIMNILKGISENFIFMKAIKRILLEDLEMKPTNGNKILTREGERHLKASY